MASDLRFLFIGDCLRDSLARRKLCWFVLIMAVRGFARTGMRARAGLRRSRVRVCCAPGSPWQARILGLALVDLAFWCL
jgi:hypothetical protein